MDDPFIESIQLQVLDFATEKRLVWETNHQLYSVIIELTPKCNFNCVHCFLRNNHSENELSYERIIEILDILYENEVLFLTFTGGDIFTRNDFLDIYMYAKRKGFIIEIYTNGALIDDNVLKVFQEYPPLLVDISLYGACEETYHKVTGVAGQFDKVIHNIKCLTENNIRVSLKAPVLNIYYDEIPKMKQIAESFCIPFRTAFEIFCTIDNDNSVQQYGVTERQALQYEFSEFDKNPRSFGEEYDIELVDLKKERPLFRCKLGRSSCVIDYKGNMCPCMSFRHIGKPLTKDSFDEIWNSYSIYRSMKASEHYDCLDCKAYDHCDICPAMMEFTHRNLEYIDPHFCKIATARYKRYNERKSTESALSDL